MSSFFIFSWIVSQFYNNQKNYTNNFSNLFIKTYAAYAFSLNRIHAVKELHNLASKYSCSPWNEIKKQYSYGLAKFSYKDLNVSIDYNFKFNRYDYLYKYSFFFISKASSFLIIFFLIFIYLT